MSPIFWDFWIFCILIFDLNFAFLGEAHKYNLRWKPANSAYWSKTVTVESSSSLCSNNYNNEETNPYDKLICHTIHNSDLQIDLEQKNVTFQVSAFNAGSKIHGDWSKSVYPSNQSDDSENDENNTILGFIVIGSIGKYTQTLI